MFNFEHFGTTYKGKFSLSKYSAGRNMTIMLECWAEEFQCWETYSYLSVNIPDVVLNDDEFVCKTYSENEGLIEQFIEKGYFKESGREVYLGSYVPSQPILKLTEKFRENLV